MLHRRTLLKGLAGLPLAKILSDPVLARAAAETTETVQLTTIGGRPVAGALARPKASVAPAVVLVHEWWGLNDQIKTMARALADAGFLALAADLFDGRVVTTDDEAKALTQAVKPDEATDTLVSWIRWARNHQNSSKKVATAGWCFGGGWALNAAVAEPVEATVVYYGRVGLPAQQLEKLKGPVLGHFGKRDKFITPDVVDEFQTNMRQAGKPFTIHWYDADHAFANPTGDNYDKEDAQVAWGRTIEFLKKELA